MGNDTDIRNKILNSPEACEQAFIEDAKFKPKNGVVIYDLLTDIYSLWNPESKNNSFTGRELYHCVCKTVLRHLKDGSCHTAVICLDNADRVPLEKRREQARRDEERVVEGLPDSTEFTDEGAIFYPGGQPHRFDIRMAMNNRSIRPRLFSYLVNCFKTQLTLPPYQTVIIDYETAGAWVMSKGHWGRDKTSMHEYGEADLSVLYWLNRLWMANRPSNFYVRSTDSDQIPILLNFLTHRYNQPSDKKQKLYLRYWRGKNAERYMDMREVYTYITTKLGWSISAFVSFCCICGTDFTDPCVRHGTEKKPRRLLFPGIKAATVFEACQKFNLPLELENLALNLRSFVYAVRAVYTHVFTNVKGRVTSCLGIVKATRQHWAEKLEELQERRGKERPFRLTELRQMPPTPQLMLPTDDQLREIFQQLRFNLRYWMIDLGQMEVTRPERGVPMVEDMEDTRIAGLMDIPLASFSPPVRKRSLEQKTEAGIKKIKLQ